MVNPFYHQNKNAFWLNWRCFNYALHHFHSCRDLSHPPVLQKERKKYSSTDPLPAFLVCGSEFISSTSAAISIPAFTAIKNPDGGASGFKKNKIAFTSFL